MQCVHFLLANLAMSILSFEQYWQFTVFLLTLHFCLFRGVPCICNHIIPKLVNYRYLRKSNCFCVGLVKTVIFLLNKPKQIDPMKHLQRLAQKRGYMLESHRIVTRDGYILLLHHIRTAKARGKPVFLMHGLMCSSADWLIDGGYAYFLADRNYDVWLGNFRGNTFSNGHIFHDYQSVEYWSFSWDQHATLDLPPMINYVLQKTSNEQLQFVGHSMGTTSLFAMLSSMPEMNEKISVCLALAPVTHIENMSGLPSYLVNQASMAIQLVNMKKIYWARFPRSMYGYVLANAFVLYHAGFRNLDMDRLEEVIDFTPAGTSTFTIQHYIQCYSRRKFQSMIAEDYHLDRVTCKTVLWYADNDWAASEKDAEMIQKQVRGHVSFKKVPSRNFGHLDFLWDKRLQEEVYPLVTHDLVNEDTHLDV